MMPDKGDKMASTEAQKRAVKKAQAKCDAIMLRPPKEDTGTQPENDRRLYSIFRQSPLE